MAISVIIKESLHDYLSQVQQTKEFFYYLEGMCGSKISCQKEQKNNSKESGGGCQIFLSSMQTQARTLWLSTIL